MTPLQKNLLLEAVDVLDNATIEINNSYEDLLQGENDYDKDYWDEIANARQLLRTFINKLEEDNLDGKIYLVQGLQMVDVQQAVGDDTLEYTHEQMTQLQEILTEKTYEGDDWSTIINNFNKYM